MTTVFATNLKAARLHAGLTLDELADAVGVDERTVRRMEAGLREPTRALVGQLAAVLDVDPGYLGYAEPELFRRRCLGGAA